MTFDLPFGSETLSVSIPDDLLGEVVRPRKVDTPHDPLSLIQGALADPIGSPQLTDLVKPGQSVSILVDDVTRETPVHLMLPPVLKRLETAGISRADIRIVIALGTHRPMSESEILCKLGGGVTDLYEVVNMPCQRTGSFEYLGESSNGIPAWVNRAVVEADVRIGIGAITPHSDAGFSGGAKIILPGVCNDVTVNAFHARGASVARNLLGDHDSPMRKDLEEFVEDRIGLDFILNAVIDANGDLYKCVAGHFVEAHRAGVAFSQDLYGVSVERQYPVVIVNSPSEMDLWLCSKGIWHGEPMVSDGGALILVTPCREGNSNHPLYSDYIGGDPDVLQAQLDSGGAEDPNACAAGIQAARMRDRIRFALVSTGLGPSAAKRMRFDYYSSVEEALEHTLGEHRNPCSVALMTHCDYTIPMVPVSSEP
tara:strand:- start:2981 stop:4255 length:1275 start_codon:yes stop_codon:yes gene_type:complete